MVARNVYKTVPNSLSTIFVANWLSAPITLPKIMLVEQCTPALDTFLPNSYEGDGIHMTQLCEKAELMERKL